MWISLLFFLCFSAVQAFLPVKSTVLHFRRTTTNLNINKKVPSSLSCSLKETSSNSTVINSAALIAGTTIGGGFLALPRATAPAGALPSTIALVGCWLFLLMGAYALVDAILHTKADMDNGQTSSVVTVFTVAQKVFGNLGGVFIGSFFFLLMMATLVAQISKGGTMLFDNLGGSRIVATLLLTAFTSLFTFSFGNDFVERTNTILTGIMLTAFVGIVSAAKGAGWQMTGLKRSNPTVFVPQFGGMGAGAGALGLASSSVSQPWAIPIFLQLLVYTEVVPVLCHRLKGNRTKIRQAIAIGSIVPLLMCICWTYVALGLIPFHVPGSAIGIGLPIDPVVVMLMHGSSSHSGSKLLARLVLTLAGSAISTTIIGAYLATSQFYLDILSSIQTTKNKQHETDIVTQHNNTLSLDSTPNTSSKKSFLSPPTLLLCSRLLTVVPPTIIAALGSTSLYYLATAFAGAFPCTMLWGLFPSLCRRILMKQTTVMTTKSRYRYSRWDEMIDVVMIGISVVMIVINFALGIHQISL